MISKNRIKLIKGLENKKARHEDNSFVAEGPKSIGDLLMTMKPKIIIATAEWLQSNHPSAGEIIEVSEEELRKVSFLMHPQEVMGVFEIPHYEPDTSIIGSRLCLALDGVQDPGNVGSILRSAAAAGFRQILLSPDCAQVWSPRVLRAAMGAHFRLELHEDVNLPDFLGAYRGQAILTVLDESATSLYSCDLTGPVAWVFGSEGQGVRPAVMQVVKTRIRIPMPGGGESLNVAAAAAICLFETVRQRP